MLNHYKMQKEDSVMAVKKVGTLIKEARTGAGLTQEQLARKIKGVSADDISKAERGEKDFTQAVLKEIAKATGVTQKSLLDAAKGSTAAKTTAAKTTAAKTTAAKTSAAKTSSAKTTAAKTTAAKTTAAKTTAKKTSAAKTTAKTSSSARKTTSTTDLKLSAEEKKIVKAYRTADDKIKLAVKTMLLGPGSISGSSAQNAFGSLMDTVQSLIGGK